MASIARIADINENEQYIADLEQKAGDAQKIAGEISNTISNSKRKLVSNVYDAVRSNLEVYQLAYTKLNSICIAMANTISNIDVGYSNYINECTDDDPVNAQDHIPKYEEEIIRLKAENDALEAEIKQLEKVPPTITEWDESTQSYTEVPNPAYPVAQAQIAADKKKIEANNARIRQLEEWLRYLRRLDSEIDPGAVSSIEDIANECKNFANEVNSIKVTNI